MKISVDRNVAFDDQPAPLGFDEAQKSIEQRKAVSAPPKDALVLVDLGIGITGDPDIRVVRGEKAGRGAARVQVELPATKLGQHVFPPAIEAVGLDPLSKEGGEKMQPLVTESQIPDHLGLRVTPGSLPRALATPPFTKVEMREASEEKFGNQATTVFTPENRRVFSDTSYPWSCNGRVDTPLGSASGAMVGPRHLLTVSHTIQWNSDGSAGWVRFRPSFFNGSTPFGEAWGTRVYFNHKVTGPTIDFWEGMFDYAVVVLDRRIGDLTGWLGGRGYTDSWDGGRYWAHVGYPTDLTAANRPTFEGSIALDGAWWQFDSSEAMSHRGDVWPGQSGGPFFGWWSDGPHAVAVQSSQNSSENNASGGQDMVNLILRARNDHP
jgi:V8-like Glu-specific endopeptidase